MSDWWPWRKEENGKTKTITFKYNVIFYSCIRPLRYILTSFIIQSLTQASHFADLHLLWTQNIVMLASTVSKFMQLPTLTELPQRPLLSVQQTAILLHRRKHKILHCCRYSRTISCAKSIELTQCSDFLDISGTTFGDHTRRSMALLEWSRLMQCSWHSQPCPNVLLSRLIVHC